MAGRARCETCAYFRATQFVRVGEEREPQVLSGRCRVEPSAPRPVFWDDWCQRYVERLDHER